MFISNDVVAAAIFADRANGCIDEGILVLRLNSRTQRRGRGRVVANSETIAADLRSEQAIIVLGKLGFRKLNRICEHAEL